MAKALEAARISSTRPPSVPSAEAHTNTLNKLEDARLSLAKAINEMESSLASKESEKARLREELHELEESDPAADHELDGTAYVLLCCVRSWAHLCLQGYGWRSSREWALSLSWRKARWPKSSSVSHTQRFDSFSGLTWAPGKEVDTHIVDLKDGKAPQETAQLLWKLASS